MTRLYLSPPDVGPAERERLLAAFDSGWIAPTGPEVDGLEADLAERTGRSVAALSSGTAAIHLGLLVEGIGPGDTVIVPSVTFAATAFAVTYTGATPVFVDCGDDGNVSVESVREALDTVSPTPRGVVAVDLYGRPADYTALEGVCGEFGAILFSDAAESLGASWEGRPAGSFGAGAAFSFNGNKIITTSGGGAYVGTEEKASRVRYLATQARQPVVHYEHTDVGYNYRLSNLLAAVGRAQLAGLAAKIERRRSLEEGYRDRLGALPGVSFLPVDERCDPNHWLTVMLVAPDSGLTPERIRLALEEDDIEARPLWKPMHQQPIFSEARMFGGSCADLLFATGLCLPSGSAMSEDDHDRVCSRIEGVVRG